MIYKDFSNPSKIKEKVTLSPQDRIVPGVKTTAEQLEYADREAISEKNRRSKVIARKKAEYKFRRLLIHAALLAALTGALVAGAQKLEPNQYINHDGDIVTVDDSDNLGR